jgi:hypothetical protein
MLSILKRVAVVSEPEMLGELSSWSGVVTLLQLNGEDFKLSMDFSSSNNYLWSTCPAFIDGGCPDIANTETIECHPWKTQINPPAAPSLSRCTGSPPFQNLSKEP